MGRFDDRATRPARGPLDVLRWKVLDPLRGARRRAAPDGLQAPTAPPDLALLASPAPSATWVGHATWLIRLGELLIATDPVWSARIGGLVQRRQAPGVPFGAVPPLDLVLVSHDHLDHMDLPTLRRIARVPGADPGFVVPLGNGGRLRAVGARRVVELDWWESTRVGSLRVTLVPARHWSMRAPWTRNDALWGGFVVEAPEGVVYFAGDTGHFEDFAEIGRRTGPIDWALLPIGAYEPRWFMEPQHMDPADAVSAYRLLGARELFAMHWGTFVLTDEPLDEPPRRLRELWAAESLDPARLGVFAVGETRSLR